MNGHGYTEAEAEYVVAVAFSAFRFCVHLGLEIKLKFSAFEYADGPRGPPSKLYIRLV